MTVYLLSIGLISILGQVILLRELNVSFYGVELIYLFALGIWLFWTAVGVIAGPLAAAPARLPSPGGTMYSSMRSRISGAWL